MPVGYPHSVGRGYLGYVLWQAVTNLAVAANTGTIAAQPS